MKGDIYYMKKYVDIEALRESDIILNGFVTRPRNDLAFRKGDEISISEKIDGSNASITYDAEIGDVRAFSHRQELSDKNTLNGFYEFAHTIDPTPFKENPNFVVFGEWTGIRNKIIYNDEAKRKWYVFDVYNSETESWYDRKFVEAFAKKYGFNYVHELYHGPFISWDHCREFMNSPFYGTRQEGVVVSNTSEIERQKNGEGSRYPFILKLVNIDFKESMVKAPKEIDPEKESAKARAAELMSQIVTPSRVEKILIKLQHEENLLPVELGPQNMTAVAKVLPKAVYEDIVKEEKEVVEACGEFAGKMCGSITMAIARNLIVGGH